MPSFGTINNGESGSSVRTKLNNVINYVNTGITQDDKYVTGGTYNNGTGTLTLNRPDGSVNVTGFTTGFTETQNLTNVLALGNTTGSNNIVVNDGQSVQSVSGNTKMEFVSDTNLTTTSTDGTNTSTESITPVQIISTTTDGTNTSTESILSTSIVSTVTDGTFASILELDPLELNDFTSLKTIGNGYNNRLQVTQGDVSLSSTDGTNTSQHILGPDNNSLSVIGSGTTGSTTIGGVGYIFSNVSDGTKGSRIDLDISGNFSGSRLYSTDGTYETQLNFDPNSISFSTFDANDGLYLNGSYQTFIASLDILSTGNVDSIALDPLNSMSADGSYISSASGATVSKLQFRPDLITISSTDGVNTPSVGVDPTGVIFKQIPAYDDDADAAAGGLTVDMLYQTTGLGAAPLDVAGILMIKQ